LNTNFEPQYDGGGADGLIDGLTGTTNWRKGNWQGYQQVNLDVVIDLQSTKTISNVSTEFLQDTRAWIIAPKQLIVELSTDGISYTQVYSGDNNLSIEDLKVQIKKMSADFPATAARYVRVKAIQYGKLPSWHEGAGEESHLFVDEINIR
jgi:hypothetical protein